MRTYFKDYKSKMEKDEEEVKKSTNLNFEVDNDSKSTGKFLKKKIEQDSTKQPESSEFFFNFNSNSNGTNLGEEMNKLNLS